MARRHGCSRRRLDRAMSGQLLSTWTGRFALLATALGLVLMHHVVGAHQHSTADPAAATTSSALSAPAGAPSPAADHTATHAESPAGHSPAGQSPAGQSPAGQSPAGHDVSSHGDGPASPAATVAPGPAPASSVALLHHHPGQDGHDHAAMLVHLCLAALVGTVVIVLLVALAVGTPAPARPAGATWASGAPTRAPPLPLRLAQLQVLRL